MKSKDLREVVMRMTDDGISPRQIAKELRNVVSDRTVRRWQHLYKRTGSIDLNVPSATMRRVIQDDLHLHAYHVTIQPNIQDDHKQRRKSFAYWVRKSLRKKDHGLILFTDEKYFGMDGIYNRQNDRVYASSRQEADAHGGIHRLSKFPKRIMVWLGACKEGVTTPITFKPGETLTHKNYIDIVLPHAFAEGQRLLGEDFIYQQDNATPHTHKDSLTWIRNNFSRFIDETKWPPNSSDLSVLDYYVWDAINHNIHWEKVKNYNSLIEEIKQGVSRVPSTSVVHSVETWSRGVDNIPKNREIVPFTAEMLQPPQIQAEMLQKKPISSSSD
ncbi:unnamed protein product, partial [Rotaria magnacalcarata]